MDKLERLELENNYLKREVELMKKLLEMKEKTATLLGLFQRYSFN